MSVTAWLLPVKAVDVPLMAAGWAQSMEGQLTWLVGSIILLTTVFLAGALPWLKSLVLGAESAAFEDFEPKKEDPPSTRFEDEVSQGEPKTRSALEPLEEISRAVVFDFDQVLSVCEVGPVQLKQVEKLVFGGEQRLAALEALLAELAGRGIALAIVSRNSRWVIQKALAGQPDSKLGAGKRGTDLLRYFTPGLIFGWEDFSDETPKSAVINGCIMQTHRLGPADVLFVDDQFLNVADVRQNSHIEVWAVTGEGGMDAIDCAHIRHWALNFKYRPADCHRCRLSSEVK
ncbi:unnamed protein product [Polarella glacialis]|uniref:Uncharacterized protein n=1 Tax=Polarella glacialis TaxID=89957 RepID=A0A813GNL8_POLGL|nr:unnamed protein product [Polarella glacialis]